MRHRHPPVLAAAALALLVAGCGGGSPGSTAAPTPTPNGPYAYARCIRSHGVPDFPDPERDGQFDKSKLVALSARPSQLLAAERPCAHLSPNGVSGPPETPQQRHAQLADALLFATCMRIHGFPAFPDPTREGQLTPQMVTAAGIDLHQPRLLRIGIDCTGVTHGWLTPAAIERAVNGD